MARVLRRTVPGSPETGAPNTIQVGNKTYQFATFADTKSEARRIAKQAEDEPEELLLTQEDRLAVVVKLDPPATDLRGNFKQWAVYTWTPRLAI